METARPLKKSNYNITPRQPVPSDGSVEFTSNLANLGISLKKYVAAIQKVTVMRLILLLFFLMAPIVRAVDEPPASEAVPEPPDLPLPIESGETLEPEEPEITIKRRGGKTIQEYRINGALYMVKIVPDAGPPYYLIDSNGDGNMDVRHTNLERNLKIPQWVLLRW